MARLQIPEQELLQLINQKIKEADYLDGDCRECRVSGLYHHPAPPEAEANWSIPSFNGPGACAALISDIQMELGREFDLIVGA